MDHFKEILDVMYINIVNALNLVVNRLTILYMENDLSKYFSNHGKWDYDISRYFKNQCTKNRLKPVQLKTRDESGSSLKSIGLMFISRPDWSRQFLQKPCWSDVIETVNYSLLDLDFTSFFKKQHISKTNCTTRSIILAKCIQLEGQCTPLLDVCRKIENT